MDTLKNHTKYLWRWEPGRRTNFFSPPVHLCAVTFITEISLHLTLSNQSHSLCFGIFNILKVKKNRHVNCSLLYCIISLANTCEKSNANCTNQEKSSLKYCSRVYLLF